MARAEVVEAGFGVEAAGLENIIIVNAAKGRHGIVQRVPLQVRTGAGIDRGLAERRAFIPFDDVAVNICHVGDGAQRVGVVVVGQHLGRVEIAVHVVDVEDLEHEVLVYAVAVHVAAEQALGLVYALVLCDLLPAVAHDAHFTIRADLRVPVRPPVSAAHGIRLVRPEQEVVARAANLDQVVVVVVSIIVRAVTDQVPVHVVGAIYASDRRVRVDRVGRVSRRDAIGGHRDAVVHAVDVISAVLGRNKGIRIGFEPRGDRAA